MLGRPVKGEAVVQDEPSSDGQEPKVTGDLAAIERAKKLVGTVVSDRYRLHNLLAMGGMGAVFTAEHVHMRKRVAIKLLHPDMEGLPGLVARFEREAIVGAHVEHPNIASARDFGKLPDGSHYLVLEFVRGVTLRQLIHQGSISTRRAVRIVRQIAEGLGAVHARGIVHRDVAPRNIMVVPGQDDHVKVIDFGFAKVPVEKFAAMSIPQGTPIMPSEITSPGVIFGTIGYLAPEAVVGMKAVTAASDLYALGSILYELLAGVPPFEGESQAALFLQHRTEPVPRISTRAPHVRVPESLEAVARRLLAKRPEERFGSAKELIAALDSAMNDLEPDTRSMPPPDRNHGLKLTVIGAEPPSPLPRFEDVAEVTFDDEPIEAPPPAEKSARSVRSVKPQNAPAKRSSLPLVLGLLALAAGGGYFAYRYVMPGAEPSAAASTPAASNVPAVSARASSTAAALVASDSAVSATPAAPTVSAVGGHDAEAWKRIVRQAPSTNNYERAFEGLLALAELDATALSTFELRTVALETAVRFGERGAKLTDALASRFGSDGIDVLYELWSKRGGSKSAEVAGQLLSQPEVLGRGTPALRVAVELRAAACADKVKVLEKVRKDGDARALALLVAARAPECDATSGECCMQGNPDVENTVRELVKKTESPR
ncbi:MAG: serine/threonine protein kinase [Polyangiaceae bacterium]|nr:serine/threonine protein kinase [Polyangiaceae bacterium]